MSSNEKYTFPNKKVVPKRGGFTPPSSPEALNFSEKEREELVNIKGPNTIPDFMLKYVKEFVSARGVGSFFDGKNNYDIKKIIWFELLAANRGRKYMICG